MDDPKINLKAGDRLVLERAGARPSLGEKTNAEGGEFKIRLFRNGKDTGLLTYTDDKGTEQAIILNKKNPTLTLSGDGKNASVEIPNTVGINATDYVPRLNIQTENPVTVTGGTFTQASSSTQKARVITTKLGAANLTKNADNSFSPEDETLVLDGQKNMLMRVMQDQSRKTFPVEEGSAGIEFVDKNNKGTELFTVNGKASFAENMGNYLKFQSATKQEAEAAWKSGDKGAQKKMGAARNTPQAKPKNAPEASSLSVAERQSVRQTMEDVSNQLASIGNQLSAGSRLSENVTFKPLLEEAQKAALDFNTGIPTAKKLERMDNAMDALREQAKESGLSNQIQKKLGAVKDSYDSVRELGQSKKVGSASSLSDDVKQAALAAAAGLRGQQAQDRPDGSPDAPMTARNPLSTGSDRTV